MQVKIVIFGFTGDLSKRKLIPALQNIDKVHSIKQIIGVSRREINAQEIINGSIGEKNSLAKKTTSVVLDSELAQYKKFKTDLNLQDDEQLLIFLSVPPNALEGYVTLLAKAGLNGKNVKLLIEKPFGTDYNSAVKMFHILNKYYNPKNVYKIDHYLLKTPAQKFNNFCLLNPKLTKVLNAKNISQVDVVAYEEIDIQGRKEFYEQVGCTRDFIQGHLLEILSVFLAKPVRKNILNSRVKANSLIKPLRNINNVKIGKYQGYDEENNVTSSAETYANFLLFSGDKKWQKVKLFLASGKALSRKESSVIFKFKNGTEFKVDLTTNVLPTSFVWKNKTINLKGDKEKVYESYEGVFDAAILGKSNLFSSQEEILHNWVIINRFLKDAKKLLCVVYPKTTTPEEMLKLTKSN